MGFLRNMPQFRFELFTFTVADRNRQSDAVNP